MFLPTPRESLAISIILINGITIVNALLGVYCVLNSCLRFDFSLCLATLSELFLLLSHFRSLLSTVIRSFREQLSIRILFPFPSNAFLHLFCSLYVLFISNNYCLAAVRCGFTQFVSNFYFL